MSLRMRVYAPPVPKMPPGLIELMDGLARDVLKNNPENIFEFCVQHMQTLLEIRDGRAPKLFMTLEQKIAKAQQRINQRAEQRRRIYDEKLHPICTESFDKQHVLPLSNVSYGSEPSEINEIENKSTEVKIEGKEKTNSTEQNKIEDNYTCTGLESNDQKEMLQTFADDKKTENKEISNQDTLNVIDSDANQVMVLLKENDVAENTTADNITIDHIENTPSEENQEITLHELKSVDIELDIENENENDVNNTMTEIQNTPDIQSDINIGSDKIIITERDNALELQNEGTESCGEIHIQTEIDDNILKDANETILTCKHVSEDATFSPVDIISENISKADCDMNTEQYEMQVDAPLINDTINENEEIVLINKTKKYSFENHMEDLTEPEVGKEDDKILAVILCTKSPETEFAETNEPDLVQNNGTDETKEILDLESVPDTTDDKTRNMNSSMDLETAAITIQKVFRSFLFKTKTASYDDPTTVDINLLNEDKEKEENNGLNININDRRPLGISRMDTVLQTVNEEKSLSLSTDDSSTLSSAATIIQAHVRGFLVRNKFNLNKTTSTNSLIDSDAPSIPSLEADSDNRKSKTVLNIHIVPEGDHFVSRDESILTSMDLSLDSSPPSSVNLHPLGYDKSERRKLKREDAIQSVSPPSNNSGKLSDELDSVTEVLTVDNNTALGQAVVDDKSSRNNSTDILTNGEDDVIAKCDGSNIDNATSDAVDEMDVITPFISTEGRSSRESDNSSKLLHSGEFHDIVIPTNVTRSDTSVVREFQNVLVYFILWNN